MSVRTRDLTIDKERQTNFKFVKKKLKKIQKKKKNKRKNRIFFLGFKANV